TRSSVITPPAGLGTFISRPPCRTRIPGASTSVGIDPRIPHATMKDTNRAIPDAAIHPFASETRTIWSNCSGDESRSSADCRNGEGANCWSDIVLFRDQWYDLV